MKRGLFIGLIGFVFLASFVFLVDSASGASCGVTDDSQLIMRLYDNGGTNTNTHGEVWNGAGGYTSEICYNTIFGELGNGDRTCTANNVVVALSMNSNAHAESPSISPHTPGYDANLVCYGSLNCEFSMTGACSAGKLPVVRLSAENNAHLEIGGGTYNNVVCCSAGGAVPLPVCGNSALESGEQCDDGNLVDWDGCSSTCTIEAGVPRAYWASKNGAEYAAGAQVNLWSTVKLVARGVSPGEAVSFEVWDDDCLTGSPPCAGDDKIVTLNANAEADGAAEYNWTIDQNSYTLGGGGSGGEGDNLELYFIAAATGYNQQSNILNVLDNIMPPTYGVCGDYTTETTCDEDQNNYAGNAEDPRYHLLNCSDPLVDCHCVWEGSTIPRCILNSTGTGPANPTTPGLECLWECSYPDYVRGDCSDNLMDISANAIFADNGNCDPGFGAADVGCIDQTTTIMCRAPLSMPFFGAGQFVMSIIAIMGIYILIGLKRRD